MYSAFNLNLPRLYHVTGLTIYQRVASNYTLVDVNIESIQYRGHEDHNWQTYTNKWTEQVYNFLNSSLKYEQLSGQR